MNDAEYRSLLKTLTVRACRALSVAASKGGTRVLAESGKSPADYAAETLIAVLKGSAHVSDSLSVGYPGDDRRLIDRAVHVLAQDDDILGATRDGTEYKRAIAAGERRHHDPIHAACVLLLQCDGYLSGHWISRRLIQYVAVDGSGGRADLTGMKHWFQPILPVALGHDRCAGIEIDVQILGLTSGYGEPTCRDLTGRNLQAGLGLAGEKRLVHAAVGRKLNAVCRVAAKIV